MNARTLKHSIGAAAIMALSVIATGCGTDLSTAPAVSTFAATPLALPAAEQTPVASFKSGRGPAISVLVSAEQGGTVRLGRYQLDFPPGALTQDTEISIRQSSPSSMTLELGPHGIQFEKPVTLSAVVDGIELDGSVGITVAWHNPDSGEWEPISEMSAGHTRASASLHHFSDYGFFEQ